MNTLITPGSGNISFSRIVSKGSDYLPPLSSSARIAYTKDGGLTIVSTASSSERLNVEGNYGSLLTVNDVISGTLFSINDVSGFPLLTISDTGSLSTNGMLFASGGNSDQWDSVYNSSRTNSANWDSVYNSSKSNSANWDSVYSFSITNSANWDSVYSSSRSNSANWNSNYTSSSQNSANWDSVYTTTNTNSAIWILDGGNTKGASLIIGTNDAYNLSFETDAVTRATILGTGGVVIGPGSSSFSVSSPVSAISGLYVDPVSGYAGFYTNAPVAPVDVRGNMVRLSAVATNGGPTCIKIQGNFGYITTNNSVLMSYDLTRTSLVSSASISTGTTPQGLYVNGKYAYVVTATVASSVFQIFDISNPFSFVLLSTTTIGVGQNAVEVVVQGNYAYVLTDGGGTNGFVVGYDISNPYAPVKVFSVQTGTNWSCNGLIVQGRYLYWCAATFGNARIYRIDITDPRGVTASETAYSGGGGIYGIAIRGRYAYINYNNSFGIADLLTSTLLGYITMQYTVGGGTSYSNVILQGNYAYVTNIVGIHKFDITTPTSPHYVQYYNIGVGNSSKSNSFAIQGRFAYLINTAANALNVFDLGGAYVQQLQAGGIRSDSLDIIGNTVLGNDLDVAGGAAFGQGFRAYKDSSVLGSLYVTSLTSFSASNYFSVASGNNITLFTVTSTGNVGIGVATPTTKLDVNGVITATGGNSNQWNSNYTTTNNSSAKWESNYTTTNTFSSSWTDYGSTVSIDSNSVTLELSAFSYFLIYLNANITTLTFRNPKTAPQITSFVLQLSADGTIRSVTWPVTVRWPGGTAPTVSNAPNVADTYTFFSYDGGISYYGFPTGYSS